MSIQRFILLQEKIKQKLKYKAAKMVSSQDGLLTFFTGLRGFHIYRSTLNFLGKWLCVLLVIYLGK